MAIASFGGFENQKSQEPLEEDGKRPPEGHRGALGGRHLGDGPPQGDCWGAQQDLGVMAATNCIARSRDARNAEESMGPEWPD